MSANNAGQSLPAGEKVPDPTPKFHNGNPIVIPMPISDPDLKLVISHSPVRFMVSAVPGGPKMTVMPDSGADVPGVSMEFLQAFEHTLHDLEKGHRAGGISGYLDITHSTRFYMYVEGFRLDGRPAGLAKIQIDAFVLPGYQYTLLMGTAWMKLHKCIINFGNDLFTIGSVEDFHVPFHVRQWEGLSAKLNKQPEIIPYSSWTRQPHPFLQGEEIFTFRGAPGGKGQITLGAQSPRVHHVELPPAMPPAGWSTCSHCLSFMKVVKNDSICFKCRSKTPIPRPRILGVQFHIASGSPCIRCRQHGRMWYHEVCFECLVKSQDLARRCPKCNTEIECIYDGRKFVWNTDSENVHRAALNCAAVFDVTMTDAGHM